MAAVPSTSFMSQCGKDRSSQVAVIGTVVIRFVFSWAFGNPSPRAATRVGELARVRFRVY